MTGSTALITGAAGDIGRATAQRLASRGWDVALTDHPSMADRLTDAAHQIAALERRVWSAVCDVTSPSSVADLVDQCCTQIGVPTALFNNAGYQGVFAPLHRYPAHDAQQVFDVNIFGAFVVLHSVAQRMVDNGGGSIVSTASMAGVSGAPNMAAYSASKAAIVAMTKSAAKDLAPHGIRVNAISPAFIGPGRMWDNQVARQAAAGSQYFPTETAEVAAQMISSIPMRRVGSVDEVAAVVDFLLSADASYVTGQNIEISGGSI